MITVVPAYGRDYKSKESVQQDWDAGKDFLIQDISCQWNGAYINKEDAKGEEIKVRYDNLRNIHIIKEEQ